MLNIISTIYNAPFIDIISQEMGKENGEIHNGT